MGDCYLVAFRDVAFLVQFLKRASLADVSWEAAHQDPEWAVPSRQSLRKAISARDAKDAAYEPSGMGGGIGRP